MEGIGGKQERRGTGVNGEGVGKRERGITELGTRGYFALIQILQPFPSKKKKKNQSRLKCSTSLCSGFPLPGFIFPISHLIPQHPLVPLVSQNINMAGQWSDIAPRGCKLLILLADFIPHDQSY